ncbi:hypothetical protein [Candidatus Phytoplasma sacchari]|uniref:Uncharacterized protein n=1 Tax=Candidatus Phytoplasma sacchari TaxID=2609813 RepID=A0ABY7M3Z0_9MOLU|nr:hypothetical protein O7R10_01885 [Candidatus Phytoplasma sacchari]
MSISYFIFPNFNKKFKDKFNKFVFKENLTSKENIKDTNYSMPILLQDDSNQVENIHQKENDNIVDQNEKKEHNRKDSVETIHWQILIDGEYGEEQNTKEIESTNNNKKKNKKKNIFLSLFERNNFKIKKKDFKLKKRIIEKKQKKIEEIDRKNDLIMGKKSNKIKKSI